MKNSIISSDLIPSFLQALISPYRIHKLRMIDKGVTVPLQFFNSSIRTLQRF